MAALPLSRANLPFFGVERIGDVPARDFGQDKHDGTDRLLVALHGWSHSQSDPGLQAATRAAYRSQRELLAGMARRWQAAGTLDPGADPEGVAQLLQSVILGFAAQRALAGDAGGQAHAGALDALTRRCPAGHPGRPGRRARRHPGAEARGPAFPARTCRA